MKVAPRSEKGLLTPDNGVVVLLDYQPQMLFGVTSIDRQSPVNGVVGFAKAARVGIQRKSLAAITRHPSRTGPIERRSVRRLHTQGSGSHCRAALRSLRLLDGESIEF